MIFHVVSLDVYNFVCEFFKFPIWLRQFWSGLCYWKSLFKGVLQRMWQVNTFASIVLGFFKNFCTFVSLSFLVSYDMRVISILRRTSYSCFCQISIKAIKVFFFGYWFMIYIFESLLECFPEVHQIANSNNWWYQEMRKMFSLELDCVFVEVDMSRNKVDHIVDCEWWPRSCWKFLWFLDT